ncbi:MAG TPA: 16S rRNA (adenine(1518)-N(6)/adenine(1519)-N(6))-dimethyltransferase RsmA [Candidatus Saccharimonadia bacterium]
MDLSNIDELRGALQLAGLRPRKGLGQHFLVNRQSLEAVMAAGKLTPNDTVVEIGPGLGVMTAPLAERVKQVVAVETDGVLVALLRRHLPKNVEIIQADIMRFNLNQLPAGYKVVANIPYYLTSAITRLLTEAENRPTVVSLLMQKEVAERITAQPGKMSILALSVQYYGQPRLLETVERHKFWPPPKVDSAVLQIEMYDKPLFEADRSKLFHLIKAGFGEKRKMLKTSLAGGLNIEVSLSIELLWLASLDLTARAQELALDDWRRLYNAAIKRLVL